MADSPDLNPTREPNLPDALRRLLEEGLPTDGRCLPVRRVWPADLSSPDTGYVVECLTDRGALAGVLDGDGARLLTDAEVAGTLPESARWREAGGRVVAHRAHKRAVLAMPDGTFVKLAKKSATRRALARAATVDELLGGVGGERSGDVPLRPVAVDADARAGWLRLERADGIALDHLLAAERHRSIDAVADSLASALCAMASVRADAHPQHDLPRHGGAQEAAILRSWVTAAAHAAPSGALSRSDAARLLDKGRRLAERLETSEVLEAAPGAALALAHRDLHEGQVLVAPEEGEGTARVTILDWDTAAWTHPALDVANLLAHVRRAEALNPGAGHRRFGQRLVDRLVQLGHPALASASGLAALEVLREAARLRVFAVHAFRPGPLDMAALA